MKKTKQMNKNELVKVAAVTAGITVASMAGLNTAIYAEDVDQPNVSTTSTSTSKQDQIINDISKAQNNVAQAKSEFTSIEQEYVTQQNQTNQAQQEAQQAQNDFDNASNQAATTIGTETNNLEAKIENVETTIQQNETTIQSLDNENVGKEGVITDAQKNVDEKQVALENAKEVATTVSDQDIADAKTVLDNAIAEKEEKTNTLENTQKQATTLESDIATNKTDLSNAQTQLAQATAQQIEAQKAYDIAKEKANTAQKVYDAILDGTAVDKDLMDKAKADVANAETGLANAEKDLTDAKISVNNYEASIKNLETEVKNNETVLNAEKEKQVQVTSLEKSVFDKQKEVDTKASAVTTAQNKKTEIDNKVSQKTNELNSAKSTKTQKESELSKTQSELATVKDKIANPSKYEVIKDAERQSSLGFFKSLGVDGDVAVKILKGQPHTSLYEKGVYRVSNMEYHKYTTIGDRKDATDLDNMKRAIMLIKEGNEIRKKEGKGELKVSAGMMAAAQVQTNAAAYKEYHVPMYGLKGENLAFGYEVTGRSPYVGWYTDEKRNYETQNGGQTGHYETLMNNELYVTGFASTQNGDWGSTDGQVFNNNYFNSHFGDKLYTIEEFERLFMAYYNANKVETLDINALKQERSVLEKKITSLQSEIKTLNTTISNTQTEINSLKKEQTAAETGLSKAKDVYNTANSELISLQNQLKTAKANCDVAKAENTLATSKTKLETAKTNLTNAKKDVTVKTTKVEEAKITLADAKHALKDLEPDLDRAATNLENAKVDLKVKIDALNSKKEATKNAKESVDTLTTSLKEKESAKAVVDKQIEILTGEKEEAESKLVDAQAEYDRLVKIRDAVGRLEKEITDLQDTIEKAKMSIDVNNARMTTLHQENEDLREVLPSYNKALSIVQAYGKNLNLAIKGEEYTIDFDEEGLYKEYAEMILNISKLRATAEEKEGLARKEQKKLDDLQPSYRYASNKLVNAEIELAEKERALQDYMSQLKNTPPTVIPSIAFENNLIKTDTLIIPSINGTGSVKVNRPIAPALSKSHTKEVDKDSLSSEKKNSKKLEKNKKVKEVKESKQKVNQVNEEQIKKEKPLPVVPIIGAVIAAGGVGAFVELKKKEQN